ncbi:MAG: hypothetical protein EOP04_01200 [Proteobacteria bacterium]|nr:MAG: hypothetical protein EOP04_01200 [Pseudomonadota bacterium]
MKFRLKKIMFRCAKAKGFTLTGQSGSALLAIIVSLGLFALTGALYTSSYKSTLYAGKVVDAKTKYETVEKAFVNEMAMIVDKINEFQCLDPNSIESRPFAFENVAGTLAFVKALPIVDGRTASLGSFQSIQDIRVRCARPTFIGESSYKSKSSSHIYFCLEFNSHAANTVSRSRSFAEVAIDFKSSRDNSAASCADFVMDPTAIAEVSYGLYLTSQYQEDDLFGKKFGRVVLKSSAGN